MKQIGFIGLGVMGFPMALNLTRKTGEPVLGFARSQQRRDEYRKQGGVAAASVEEVCSSCDRIFLCLPTNAALQGVVEEILEKAATDTVVVDMGSTSPHIIKELNEKAAAKKIHLMDSPVSGGEAGAVGGTLAIMVGGEKGVYDRIEPLLQCMGSSVTYLGPSGCGSVAKVANNMIVGSFIAAVGESFAFAVKAGLDPQVLFDAIKGGSVSGYVMNVKVPRMLSRNFVPGARIAVHQKDLQNAMDLAEQLDVEIPMAKMVFDYMHRMEEEGRIDEDHSALVKVYEEQMGVKVVAPPAKD